MPQFTFARQVRMFYCICHKWDFSYIGFKRVGRECT